ncbi:MAG: ABC transporter ATP-binding protein [Bacteroidota bacterium]
MALLADPGQVEQSKLLQTAYTWGGFTTSRSFIIAAGIAVILLLALSRFLAVLINFWRERYQWGVYSRISNRMLAFYTDRPYRYFLDKNTADLRGYVINEVMNVVTSSLGPIITLMINGGTALVIILLVLAVNHLVAITSALVLGGAYLLIYQIRKRPLERLGAQRLAAAQARQRVLEEMLQGIKTVKIYGNEKHFAQRYREATAKMAHAVPRLIIIFGTPKYVLEVLAFCGIIGVTLLLYLRTEDIGQVLPTLTLFAVAGYRLLPSLQQVFGAYATIRANRVVLDQLYPDLMASLAYSFRPVVKQAPLPFLKALKAEQLDFTFPNADKPLFQNLSLSIPHGQVVAFVGLTGSGKTTLVDLLTGLLEPSAGKITIDDTLLSPTTIQAWRSQLAYVPQEVFLYDASLRENIIFASDSIPTDEAIMQILDLVSLGAFVRSELPNGLNTLLGENGVRLSGGQRQRVGLARALLRQPSVLVLDEATSALDTLTENTIIKALAALPEDLTVLIIAHRLSTVRYADVIYLLEGGRIVASGTYQEMEAGNARFREMAALYQGEERKRIDK